MIEFYTDLIELDCLEKVAKSFFTGLLARFTGVIAFIDGLQQVGEFSGGFVEDL